VLLYPHQMLYLSSSNRRRKIEQIFKEEIEFYILIHTSHVTPWLTLLIFSFRLFS
jgi:hypothetical protein